MPKHRLFNSSQESPHLNSSRDETNIEALTPRSKGKENANKYPHEAHRSEKNSNPTVQPQSFPKPGGEVGSKKGQCADNNKNVNQFHSRDVSMCVSDSDSMDEIDFFSRGNSNVKLPYTLQEDEFIIKYVLKGRNIFRASSVSLWKILEAKKENPKRTYQSLKNRFLKSIKPRLFTTYSYLIKDKETENIILEKYPDLKKRGMKRDVFSVLNLPKRIEITDFSDDDLNQSSPVTSSVPQNPSNQNQNSNNNNQVNERKSEPKKTTVSESLNRNKASGHEFTHLREVTVRKDATIVTVKFRRSLPKNPSALSPVGIYLKFLALKNQNNLVPCPTCSKLGFKASGAGKNPDESESDSDDNFIPNSVETPDKPNSKPPPESNPGRRSLPLKEVEKSPSVPNSRKSKSNSKGVRNISKNSKNAKNSSQRDSQNSPAVAKGAKTNSSNSQNGIGSKELKQLLEDSYSQNILKKMLSKNSPAHERRKTNSILQSSDKSLEKTPNAQTPPSRNLRKSVRKGVVKKVSNDMKTKNIVTRKQPRRNVDIAKSTTTTAEMSGSKRNGRRHLDRRAKKSINYYGKLEKPKKKSNVYKLPLRISALTHRERFILRKVLRRTYRIYRKDVLENKIKDSKSLKKNLKKKQINREQKNTNLQSQSESDSLNDNYLRSLYKETVAECQKLVNSDEEERTRDQNEVRISSRRQNTVDSQGFDDEQLKSFFMESETETELTTSCTQDTTLDFNDKAMSSLADNMMKMLSKF